MGRATPIGLTALNLIVFNALQSRCFQSAHTSTLAYLRLCQHPIKHLFLHIVLHSSFTWYPSIAIFPLTFLVVISSMTRGAPNTENGNPQFNSGYGLPNRWVVIFPLHCNRQVVSGSGLWTNCYSDQQRTLPINMQLLHFAWVADDVKCISVTRVCLSVCLSVTICSHYCTDAHVTWGNGSTVPPSCALLGCIAMAT